VDLQAKTAEVPLLLCPTGLWLHDIVTEHPSYAAAGAKCFPHRKVVLPDNTTAIILKVDLI
jgi:hypothetical protein